MTAQQLSELDLWLDQYSSAVADADVGTVAATWAAYAVIEDWYDPAQTLAAAAAAAKMAESARSVHAGLIGEFLSLAIEISGGARALDIPKARPLRLVPDYGRQADPFDVYSRPVFEYRQAVSRGLKEDFALAQAEVRAEVISLTDALLARRDAATTTFKAAGVKRYRRVIRPELSETGTCGLCIAASTQIYSVSDLLEIHSRCKCTVLPIIGGVDPGDINVADLEKVYEGIPATRRDELSKYRYKVLDDGELGQVLAPKTSVSKAKAPELSPPERALKELAALLPVLDSLEARAAAGENVAGPLAYQRDRIAKLRALSR